MVSGCAHAELPKIPPEGTVNANFPVSWMEQMLFAYDDFRSMKSDTSCYVMTAFQEEQSYFIVFAPRGGPLIEGDKISFPVVGGASECGRAIKYEFDASGKFVQSIGIR